MTGPALVTGGLEWLPPYAFNEMTELRVLHSLRSVMGVRLGSWNLPRLL